jgi:hypothetical protein
MIAMASGPARSNSFAPMGVWWYLVRGNASARFRQTHNTASHGAAGVKGGLRASPSSSSFGIQALFNVHA